MNTTLNTTLQKDAFRYFAVVQTMTKDKTNDGWHFIGLLIKTFYLRTACTNNGYHQTSGKIKRVYTAMQCED